MSELFVLQNHEKLLLSKQGAWVDGRDLNVLYKSAYKDEAINQMVEVSSKDYRQRIQVLSCSPTEKGLPLIPADLLPEPLPKQVKDLFEVAELTVTEPEVSVVDVASDVAEPRAE
jgi:hypothetical protein